MNWKDEIEQFLIRSIDLFLKYHTTGNLEGISLSLYVLHGYTEVAFTISGREEPLNYDLFKIAKEDAERDSQRECYFEEESIWAEFFMDMNEDDSAISACMEEVAAQLRQHYHTDVALDVICDE